MSTHALETIDTTELTDVQGGFTDGGLSGLFGMIGQLGSAAIQVYGPRVWDTGAGGITSFLQSVMYDGDAPVLDGILGAFKGATKDIGGPMPVNSFSDGRQVPTGKPGGGGA